MELYGSLDRQCRKERPFYFAAASHLLGAMPYPVKTVMPLISLYFGILATVAVPLDSQPLLAYHRHYKNMIVKYPMMKKFSTPVQCCK